MAAEIKPICGLDRVPLKDVIPLDTPFTLFIFPTTFCNFKCNYCGHSLGYEEMKKKYNFEPQMMSESTFLEILEQARKFNQKFKVVSLTGHGEPMLNPNLANMIRLVKKSNIADRIEVISNASLLTYDLSDKLIESGLDILRISIQGLSSQKYNDVCNFNLDFQDLIKNIKYFYDNKQNCKVHIKIMDVALNEGEEALFYELFEKICDRMYIEKCRPVYDGVEYNDSAFEVADRYGRVHKKREVCPLPFFMLGIFPNGDVEPCDTIYKPIILGNVHENTLLEMWNGNKLKEFQKMQLEKKRNINLKCKVCYAPDDVSHPEDDLDNDAKEIIERIK